MSESESKTHVHGIVAEYDSVDTLLAACNRVREAGYQKIDAYTPFPVHGIDKALGIKPTVLPWIALVCGLAGTTTAIAMQVWMNAIDYPYIISGKPFVSLPAFMPVAFELTILFASFGTFFGMWALNRLPKLSDPIFTDPRFDRATDDKFFLYVDAKDDKYDADEVLMLLGETGTEYTSTVVDDDSPSEVPRPIYTIWMLVIGLSLIPFLVVLKMRLTRSDQPRFHVFFDMDFSPAKDAQAATTLFADARTMRPDVRGTVYRGQLDMDVLTGVDMRKLADADPARAARLVAYYDNDATADDSGDPSSRDGLKLPEGPNFSGDPNADDVEPRYQDADGGLMPAQAAGVKAGGEIPDAENSETGTAGTATDNTPWLKQIPVPVDEDLVYRGQQQFNIYCAVCHGRNGAGQGLVHQRALRIAATNWIPPSSLHDPTLYDDQYADGKLFSTITNGIRKMPGYGSQIKVMDRWAIVAYVRALQETHQAELAEVPAELRDDVAARRDAVQAKLEEEARKEAQRQAEAEAKRAGKSNGNAKPAADANSAANAETTADAETN